MTDKDTIYSYGAGKFLCFILSDPTAIYGKGNSLALSSNKYFNWAGKIPKDLKPIGQRCILQWQ